MPELSSRSNGARPPFGDSSCSRIAATSLLPPARVVAQVWRGGNRQARFARLLASDLVTELALDSEASRRIGVLATAARGARDVVDGHVAVIALHRDAVVLTSDPEDIARWGVPAANIVSC
jgi:predicted nucleic acid-binding protein